MMVNVGLFSRLEIRVQGSNIIRTAAETNCIYLVNKMTSLRSKKKIDGISRYSGVGFCQKRLWNQALMARCTYDQEHLATSFIP